MLCNGQPVAEEVLRPQQTAGVGWRAVRHGTATRGHHENQEEELKKCHGGRLGKRRAGCSVPEGGARFGRFRPRPQHVLTRQIMEESRQSRQELKSAHWQRRVTVARKRVLERKRETAHPSLYCLELMANDAHFPRSIQAAVMKLFQMKKYPDLAADLPDLNEKLK